MMITGEASRIGGEMNIQQALIDSMRQGIAILQTPANVIIQEAGEIFQGIHKQIFYGIKKQMENGSTLLNYQISTMQLQDEFGNCEVI
jgi:hypothetical protein